MGACQRSVTSGRRKTSKSIRSPAPELQKRPRTRDRTRGTAGSGEDGPVVEMSREEFEDAVRDALDEIPEELAAQMDNVVVLVEDEPPEGEPELLGVYDGVPLTERGEFWAAG